MILYRTCINMEDSLEIQFDSESRSICTKCLLLIHERSHRISGLIEVFFLFATLSLSQFAPLLKVRW